MNIDYMDKFRSEYLCKPYLDEKWEQICKAAQEYEERCELYDRVICSGMKDDIAIPMNGQELALINIHARKVRKEVMQKFYLDWRELKKGLNRLKFLQKTS